MNALFRDSEKLKGLLCERHGQRLDEILERYKCTRNSFRMMEACLPESSKSLLLRRGWSDLVSFANQHLVAWLEDRAFVCSQVHAGTMQVLRDLGLFQGLITYLGSVAVVIGGGAEATSTKLYVYSMDSSATSAEMAHLGNNESFHLLLALAGQNRAHLVQLRSFRHNQLCLSPESLACLNVHDRVEFFACDLKTAFCQNLAALTGSVSFADSTTLADGGRAVFEAVGRNQGPTQLRLASTRGTRYDPKSLRNMLSNTSSLKVFEFAMHVRGTFDIPSLIDGLERNESLETLTVARYYVLDEEERAGIIRSLRTHPTLRVLHLEAPRGAFLFSSETKVRNARTVLEMLETNEVMTEIRRVVPGIPGLLDRRIFEDDIRPRLKNNLRRARLLALLEERDELVQKKLVGAALCHQVSRDDASFMWLLVTKFYPFITEQYERKRETVLNGPIAGRLRRKRKLESV